MNDEDKKREERNSEEEAGADEGDLSGGARDAEDSEDIVDEDIVDEAEILDEPQGSPQDPASGESEDEAEGLDPETVPLEELAALQAELEKATRERDEYLDSLRRLKAEFDNSRKRQEKERERILQNASERLILALLPALDNLDRALDSEGDIREGVRATRDQLSETLQGEGLLPVDSDGEHFDPNIHEAVMSQPSDEHEEGTILQTFERGYTLNGKSIRPAKVVVAQEG